MFFILKNYAVLAKDLFTPIQPEKILTGKKLFRPFLSYQNAWLKYFYKIEKLETSKSPWSYLHQYVMPLVVKHGSSYHLEGIEQLKLNAHLPPDFEDFKKLFEAISKFKIIPVTSEIAPLEYFKYISQKKFPCIFTIRSHEELFCGFRPDFWHEAIGHLAPLCHPEVQDFYLDLADRMLSAKTKIEFKNGLSIAWTITEYGFIKQKGENKMFGAALIGSHLAHMRYVRDHIEIERGSYHAILGSRYNDETAPIPRAKSGKIRFFYFEDLDLSTLFDMRA